MVKENPDLIRAVFGAGVSAKSEFDRLEFETKAVNHILWCAKGSHPYAVAPNFQDPPALLSATVLIRRYALDGGPPGTLREVAKQIGRSPERVRQLEAKALRVLRRQGKRARKHLVFSQGRQSEDAAFLVRENLRKLVLQYINRDFFNPGLMQTTFFVTGKWPVGAPDVVTANVLWHQSARFTQRQLFNLFYPVEERSQPTGEVFW